MKFRFLALLALVLGLASCQNDPEGINIDANGEAAVTLNVSLPEEATRAAGANSALGAIGNIDVENSFDIRYILEVYNPDGTPAKDRMTKIKDTETTAAFSFRLIPGRGYKFVVWADFVAEVANPDDATDLHYNTTAGLRAVTVVTDNWTVIDESRDAYTGVADVANFSGASSVPEINLTRPFAKLRVVTNDIKEMISVRPAEVKVKYFNTKFYDTFDAFAEQASGSVDAPANLTVKLIDATNPDTYTGETPETNGVQTLFADYFFGAEDDRVMFTLDVKDNGTTPQDLPQVTFNTNIPVKRNYLTTVYGPILTDSNNITVTIDSAFENVDNNGNGTDPDYEVKVVDSAVDFLKALNDPKIGHIVLTQSFTITAEDIAAASVSTFATRAGEAEGNTTVINLNGFTITFADGAKIEVEEGTTVVIEDNSNNQSGKVEAGTDAGFENNGTITIEGGTIGEGAIKNNGTANIEGGTIESGAIKNNGTTNVNEESNVATDAIVNSENALQLTKVAEGLGIDDAGTYYIIDRAGIFSLAELVNAGNALNGKTVKLNVNVDLANEPWTPIGNDTNKFQGIFDGQGHKISNLVVTGNNSYVGLFGFTANGEIKNLVVENAKVSGYLGVGVVAGSPYTSKFNDITVQGHVEVNGMAYVGGVGGRNAYASWDGVTVNVDASSYVNANSVENGTAYRTYVGGVCGFNGEGGHSFKNITSNIDVKGSTIDVGGLFGIAHYGNQFENCSCSGDVEIYAAEEAEEAQEIGGIAGVWNNGGADVVFANCSFTGKLKTNIVDVDFYYGGLVGKPYSATGTGKLYINGCEMVANGVGLKDGEYYIQSVAGLKWLAEQVNGGNNFSKKVVKLVADLDLNNEEWTPIGNGTYSFQGTFDGQNHKVANLAINAVGKSNIGLFGFTTNGEIKNLVVENAKVVGRLNVGVVAGTPYTSKFNNITVQGHVEVDGMSYVGGVGGKNAYANWTNITVNVDETSYVNANSVEDGTAYRTYVGGVCGFNGEGGHSFTNITSNIDVKGSTIDVGGLFGIAHYGNQFENCSCSGDVEIYAAEDAVDAQEIGGIAGVWNNGGEDVVFANCTFTGTLKTNIAVDFYYGGLVGKPYSATGTGKLYINGCEMVANGVGLKDGEYYIQSVAGLKWFANEVNVNKNAFAGKSVKLVANIDLKNEAWTPVGQTGATTFNGIFDGQNYTISNLNVNSEAQTGEHYSSGLFGWVESHTANHGHLKNVKIENATIVGHHNCGALVGYITQQTALVENCHVTGANVSCTHVNDDADGDKAGALIGNATVATPVKDCTATKSTISSGRDAGQLIGAGREANVTGCSATEVTVKANGTSTGANIRNEVIGRLL